MKRLRLPLAILVIAVVVAVLVGFVSTRSSGTSGSSSSTSSSASAPAAKQKFDASAGKALQNVFVSVYRKVAPSVVQISTSEGLGSGIVFDKNGDIVTNAHVVGNATTFAVTTSTGKQLKGKLVGKFTPDDLAVIKVSGNGLRPASFADSSRLRVGDIAMAIGNPLGLRSSVTQGIVSALGRQAPEGGSAVLQNAIQTSAAINPGNSGGALVDISGDVIGIPTLAALDPQLGGAASGIGFAIPSNTVQNIASQIVKHGHVVNSNRAYLGVRIGDTGNGVYVGQVTKGGPADKAGIEPGDVIQALDGKPTPSSDALGSLLATKKPGQTVTLKIVRQDGSTKQVKVKLGEFPGQAGD